MVHEPSDQRVARRDGVKQLTILGQFQPVAASDSSIAAIAFVEIVIVAIVTGRRDLITRVKRDPLV